MVQIRQPTLTDTTKVFSTLRLTVSAAKDASLWSTPSKPWSLTCSGSHCTLTCWTHLTDSGFQRKPVDVSWKPVHSTNTCSRRNPTSCTQGWRSTYVTLCCKSKRTSRSSFPMFLGRLRFPALLVSVLGSTATSQPSTCLSTLDKPSTKLSFTWRHLKRCPELRLPSWKENSKLLMTQLTRMCQESRSWLTQSTSSTRNKSLL